MKKCLEVNIIINFTVRKIINKNTFQKTTNKIQKLKKIASV